MVLSNQGKGNKVNKGETMNPKDRQAVYEKTGARVYYNRIAKLWCALWIENGFECKVLFRNGRTVEEISREVLNRRLTAYTFSN